MAVLIAAGLHASGGTACREQPASCLDELETV